MLNCLSKGENKNKLKFFFQTTKNTINKSNNVRRNKIEFISLFKKTHSTKNSFEKNDLNSIFIKTSINNNSNFTNLIFISKKKFSEFDNELSNKIKSKKKKDNKLNLSSKIDEFKEEDNNFKEIEIKDSDNIKLTNKFIISITNNEFLNKYKNLFIEETNSLLNDITEKVAGRIISFRVLGKSLTFITVSSNGDDLQVVFDINKLSESSIENLNYIKRGFIIGIEGNPYKTKTGEISLLAKNFEILSICNYELPDTKRKDKQILTNFELRYEKRFLDLIVNNKNKKFYLLRSKIISFLRNYLEKDGYLEVETPILSKKAGGALAVPFETYSQAIKHKLFLRIAPELYLKQLIIGGYERVYEIGKNFRNESISVRHNPEFTSCELYRAYADYNNMIDFTKNFLKDLCMHLYNKTYIEIELTENSNTNKNINTQANNKLKIDFGDDFNVFDVNKELENYFNTNLSNITEKELYYNKLEKLYDELLIVNGDFKSKILANEKNFSIKKKIDKLIEFIIEPKCIGPSFIVNHPILLSPLAKSHDNNKNIAERFEFFINKIELINSYSELNDATEQKFRFIEQSNLKNNNTYDDEIHPTDEDFLEALGYGMPPTAGWGIGVDRLCMVFLGLNNIKEIILFPLMNVDKNKNKMSVSNTGNKI